jgi:hypothetical protein
VTWNKSFKTQLKRKLWLCQHMRQRPYLQRREGGRAGCKSGKILAHAFRASLSLPAQRRRKPAQRQKWGQSKSSPPTPITFSLRSKQVQLPPVQRTLKCPARGCHRTFTTYQGLTIHFANCRVRSLEPTRRMKISRRMMDWINMKAERQKAFKHYTL